MAFNSIIARWGRPHFGGHIERLIGTMMGAVHLLPGTTFSSVDQRGAYESEKHALLTLPELERWLALQIAGVYHLSVHSALGKTPMAAWQAGIALLRPFALLQNDQVL
jgi:putative transposase